MAVNPFSGQKVEGFAHFYREKPLRHICAKHNCTYIIVRVSISDNHVYSVAEYYGPMCLRTCGSASKYIKFICRSFDQRAGEKVEITENRRERVKKAMDRLPDVSYLS